MGQPRMSDELKQLEDWVAPLIEKLTPKERRALARDVAGDLRRSQVARIKAQKNPDGSGFKNRKPQKVRKPKNDPVRFLYKKPGGVIREAMMVSWQDQGLRMTGYDREVNAIRTFRRDRVERWLKPNASGSDASKLRSQRGKVRDKAMFTKMRTAKYLKIKAGADSASVGFLGSVARIARVHQYGLRDRVKKNGPQHHYDRRQLLGFTAEDRERIRDSLIDHLTEK